VVWSWFYYLLAVEKHVKRDSGKNKKQASRQKKGNNKKCVFKPPVVKLPTLRYWEPSWSFLLNEELFGTPEFLKITG